MARTTSELLAQLQRLVPGSYASAEALLAAVAAAMAQAEAKIEELASTATYGGAAGVWLTLHALGLGIRRGSGEADAGLLTRLRLVEDAVTKPAIEAAVNALIAPDTCTVREWWEGPWLDSDAYLDVSPDGLLSGGPSSFLVLLPQQDTDFAFGAFADADLWLDTSEAVIGDAPEDPTYAGIINHVNRMRAAGVFWRLVLES